MIFEENHIKSNHVSKTSTLVFDIISNDFVMVFTNFVPRLPFISILSSNLQHFLSQSVTPPYLNLGLRFFKNHRRWAQDFLGKMVFEEGWGNPYGVLLTEEGRV